MVGQTFAYKNILSAGDCLRSSVAKIQLTVPQSVVRGGPVLHGYKILEVIITVFPD